MGKIDYKKLTQDLIIAKNAAINSIKNDDGGSANLDCLSITLPRYREEKVVEAVLGSGLYTSGRTNWYGPCYMINAPIGRQGNDNTRQVEAMYEKLKVMGYDVLVFSKAD